MTTLPGSQGIVPSGDTVDTAAFADAPNAPRRAGGFGKVWWRHALAWVALFFSIFPILFVLSAALNPAGSLSTTTLIPRGATLDNFRALLNDPSRPFGHWYTNSLVIGLVAALASTFIGALSAYVFSRMRFRGRRAGLMALLLLQMFPALLAFVGIYITFAKVGEIMPAFGLNTSWGLILVYLGGAMGGNVWLFKGYFDTIPKELDEAALVDGASHARIFFTMTLRLVMPILVTVFMTAFVGVFGEFLLASIFLTNSDSQTLAVGLYQMTQGNTKNALFGEFAAGALLSAVPIAVLYLVFQRQLVGGLTQGSVK